MIGWLATITAIIAAVLFFVSRLNDEQRNTFSNISGSLILMILIIAILIGGVYKKVPVFDAFIDGAKDGFNVVLKIIPYLVGMLVAIRVFRDCGGLYYVTNGIAYFVKAAGLNTDFVPSLPTAIMRPFSGSGARGMMIDTMKTYGPDSFIGKLACTFQGSADTTFYILALYFGSVGIKNARYAVWVGIAADFIGVIAAIFIGYLFFK